jgi:carboxymethylenebutenolidase
MTPQWIDVTTVDGTFKCYRAEPATGVGPGLVLLQEIFGVNAHIRGVAEQYAQAGYTVIVPDVFWRQRPGVELGYSEADFAIGIDLMNKTDREQAIDDLRTAVEALRKMASCSGKVASLGYCMGGRLSYFLAASGAVDAAVCYYPGGVHFALDIAPQISVPILFHFAGRDRFIRPDAVLAVQAVFEEHPQAEIHVYDGVDHGFNCWDRSEYDAPAASLALARTLDFLHRTVGD